QFVMHASNNELLGLNKFVHRTFNGQDALAFVDALRKAYNHKGLQALFTPNYPDIRLQHAAYMHPLAAIIFNFRYAFTKSFKWQRSAKHIGNPYKNSSAKRMCMFLRWMVRQDKNGVDFGIWRNINPADLICPLDVHSGNVARQLGLLTRPQNDWKAAVALTESLKQYNTNDPTIFDFALFGMGVNSKRLAVIN
ncbi:MAG TPA: TIGR02757 family protein, partial [Bacteroidia bacterium]|nr:TIGR02757 family protein [Bacteroidia bacterium]